MKKTLLGLAFLPFMFGFGSKHSNLEATSVVNDKEIRLTFKISPTKDMVLTHEAPWSLTLDQGADSLELSLKEGKYKTTSYDEKLPGFTVISKIKPGVSEGSIKYKLKAFVCTKDKTRCYPQTHKGDLKWAKS